MASDAPTPEMALYGTGQEIERNAAFPDSLLACGLVVGPFYLAVGLIQAFVRDGFNLSRHALSLLANGPGGWVQTMNFVLSGLMVVAVAVGFARTPGLRLRKAAWFLGAFGVSMLVAAIFPADPMDGFPIGTPPGYPETVSRAGVLHFAAGGIGFLMLATSCLVAGRALSRAGLRRLARVSVFSGIGIVAGFFSPMFIPIPAAATAGIWFAVVVGWAWLAAVSAQLRQMGRALDVARNIS